MRTPTGIILLLILCGAIAKPRTKEHEWMSGAERERSVRSETLEQEIQTALEAALEGQQEEEGDVVLVTEKPVFVKDHDDVQKHSDVKPQDDNYVVPSYSPVGSENEFGSEDTNKLTPSLILDIEKQLQAEMGQMKGQLSLLHTLVSSIFGQQVTLNPKEDFDPNVVVVNVPQQHTGSIGDHNPFNFGFDPFLNDNNDDDATDDNDDDAWSWFEDRPKFPSLSDVFGFPDSKLNKTFGFPELGDIGFSKNDTEYGLSNFFGELPDKWSNLPKNYSNSTHEIQHVNGSVIDVNEAINKQTGDGFHFFSHKQVINVRPEDTEIPNDSNQENENEFEADAEEENEDAEEQNENTEEPTEEVEEKTEEAEENEKIVDDGRDFENSEIITRNENEIEDGQEEVQLIEMEIENEHSEFPEFKMESDNGIEEEVSNSIQKRAL